MSLTKKLWTEIKSKQESSLSYSSFYSILIAFKFFEEIQQNFYYGAQKLILLKVHLSANSIENQKSIGNHLKNNSRWLCKFS